MRVPGRQVRSTAVAVLLALACGDPYAPTPQATPSASVTPPTPTHQRTPAEIRASGNHLVDEASPYLQQHAHNPIDWHPWSAATLALAKAQGKPIFVSIGYSTCHWCHVMERESFDDDVIAGFLNANFVAIKVDREQRPDVDALYLAAVAALGGDTGWPLNVFLTPDGIPIVGGTYFPPIAGGGRPGFLELAQRVHGDWIAQGNAVAERGQQVFDALARRGADPAVAVPTAADLEQAMENLARSRDEVRGGFGSRQKFPNAPALLAELRWSGSGGDDARTQATAHVVTSLERMRDGGLRDALGGTFHRYCVDPDWRIPHFEKTLYDNAQLAVLYLEASQRLQRPDFAATAGALLDDVLAHWSAPGGGFIVGFDADDAGGEGTYYTWTPAELAAVLEPADADAVAAVFGVSALGDRELAGRSVLRRTAGPDPAMLAVALAAVPTLALARTRRPAPARDDKVLVAWNALVIEALIEGARVLDRPRYLEAAIATAAFLETHATRGDSVRRGVKAGVDLGDGFADDHAGLARALLRLHAATGELTYLARAHALARALLTEFWDPQRGGVRRSRALRDDLPVATLDMDDQATPAAGAVTAALWLEIGALVGDDALWDAGLEVLTRWRDDAVQNPASAGTLLTTMDAFTLGMQELVIAGDRDHPTTLALIDTARDADRGRVFIARVGADGVSASDAARWPALAGKRAQAGIATAFLCTRGSCRAPTSDPAVLRTQLAAVPTIRGRP